MPRITATISGLERYFLTHLARVDTAAAENALRLSTGNAVNTPSDNPAAFIRLSGFEQRLGVVQDAKRQVDVAAGVGAEAQLALDSIRSELGNIRDALELDVDGSLTSEERLAQQATIDASLQAIADLSKTEINGRRYLDGSVDFRISGKDSAQIREVRVQALRETTFSGTVSAAATQASVTYTGSGGSVTADATFSLTGERGSSDISLTNGMSLTDAASAINEVSHETGIIASVAADDLTLTSVDYGSDAVTTVEVTSGSFTTSGSAQGTDASVTINGQAVSAADGNRVQYTSPGTNLSIEFQPGFTGAFTAFSVSDADVAQFRLLPDSEAPTTLAITSTAIERLGGLSGELADLASGESLAGLSGNTSQAIRVVDEALASLTRTEGAVDAFADIAVESAGNLLDGLGDQLETTISDLNTVDETEESLLLSKNQSLGTNTVSAIAILQQQQASMLALIQSIAGI